MMARQAGKAFLAGRGSPSGRAGAARKDKSVLKIMGIAGSPRRHGNSTTLLEAVLA